jgi:hypothetical protein
MRVLSGLCVSQAAIHDPDIAYHHCRDAKYNQAFHFLLLFLSGTDRKLRCGFDNALYTAWTGMTPTIAIAAGDHFGFAEWDFSPDRVLQQLRGTYGFVI